MTAAKIGAKKLSLLSTQPFVSQASFERRRAETDEEIAETLFHGLSLLRGSVLKIAQVLSLETDLYSEAYQKEFRKAHYQVPPLNRAVVRRVIRSEFGKDPEELFKTFEATAFAAASLGQVHRATTADGLSFAVKLQYPGIDRSIQSDVQLARQIVHLSTDLRHVTTILDELALRLAEEVDYHLERQTTQWFHDHGCIPGVIVPQTYEQYSSARVLATELLPGMHLDAWIRTNPPQILRDRAAQLLHDFFMHSLFDLQKIHADPNPGNYLFQSDGTVAAIDFGSVKTLSPTFRECLTALLHAYLQQDHERIIPICCELGLAHGNPAHVSPRCKTRLTQFGDWISKPYREELFDFGQNAEFILQGRELIRDLVVLREMDGLTTDTILFKRTIYGLFVIFTRLNARVRMQNNQWLF